jgi:hypothetical protein
MRDQPPITASLRLFAPVALLCGVFAIIATLWLEDRDDWHVTRGIDAAEAIEHIQRTAGPAALACGDMAADVMAECVRSALAGSRPFWAVYIPGINNLHHARWGFIRDERGRLLLAFHDNHRALYYEHCKRMFVPAARGALPKCELESRPGLLFPQR